MVLPKISVIVPTHNRPDTLAECLTRLCDCGQYLDSSDYEIIVSDDSTNDRTAQLIEKQFPSVHWLKGPCRGPAANRNNGANNARAPWLAFTDDDCLPDQYWLSELLKALSPSLVALEGTILPIGDINKDMAQCPVNIEGGRFWSANIAVQTKFFLSIGGFDETYRLASMEDIDLHIRISSAHKIPFIREAIVYHPVRIEKVTKKIRKIPQRLKNWAYHVSKHSKKVDEISFHKCLLDAISFHGRSTVRHIKDRQPKNMTVSALTLLLSLILLPIYLRKAKRRLIEKAHRQEIISKV